LAISVPWPDVDLPDWQVPDWVGRLIDRVKYVWPVALAWVLARWEIKRRREQEALKAQLKAEALGSGQARTDSHPDRSPPSGARPGRDEAPTTADEGC
jgi:hypothetical protein